MTVSQCWELTGLGWGIHACRLSCRCGQLIGTRLTESFFTPMSRVWAVVAGLENLGTNKAFLSSCGLSLWSAWAPHSLIVSE